MLKYVAMFAVVFALAVFVARQDERAAQERTQKSAQLGNATVSANPDEQHPKKHRKYRRNAPGWYSFFRWPNGTTTWAIILTLLAIAEQTSQTRKAAEATLSSAKATKDSVSAFVASQGPQIMVIAHGNPPNDLLTDPPRVQMELHNQGPTTARELSYEFWAEVLPWESVDFTSAAYYPQV